MRPSKCLLVVSLVPALCALAGGSGFGQERQTVAVTGGGVGVRLDAGAGHVMIAYHADGGVRLECLQGDEHEAVEGLARMLERAAADRAEWADSALREGSGTSVFGAIEFDPTTRAGADDRDRPLLYMPAQLQPGSSRSHFDTRAFPNLLMEPAINPDLALRGTDITADALADLGWRTGGGMEAILRFQDAEGEGFNDPVLGPARRAALRTVARIWGRELKTRHPVVVDAQFLPLFCQEGVGAALAAAGPAFAFRDFDGALPDTWYPGAMADSIARADLAGEDEPDLVIFFNSEIDNGCLGEGTGWYYDTEGTPPPTEIGFVPVGLHEMAHGLGFTGFVDLETGDYFQGYPDIYTRATRDNRLDRTWDQMGRAQRRRSATRDGEVALEGNRSRRGVIRTLGGSAVLRIDTPATIADTYGVGVAAFGPRIEDAPIAGELALADDGTAEPRLACSALVNGAAVAGKIAVVARGACDFQTKVANAQAAGAIGVIVANNVPGGPINMGGNDASITIPSVMVSRLDGARIREALR